MNSLYFLVGLILLSVVASIPISQDAEYIKELWTQENAQKAGYKNGKWYAIQPPELQKRIISTCDFGPGLKLPCTSEGYTQSEIDQKLTEKLEEIETKLRRQCKSRGKDYDSLGRYQKWLLVDFTYNLGDVFSKFPKFAKAVLDRDLATMKAEYERSYTDPSGQKKLQTERNKWTKNVIQKIEDGE